MTDYQKIYESKKGTVEDALNMIKSGDIIWCSNNYNEPETLFGRLHEIADRVDNVIVYKSRIGSYPFMLTPGMNGHINCHNYFYGPSYRQAHKLLNASFIPVDLPNYYRMVNRHKPCNIFTAQVSPMDEEGNLYVGMNQTIEYYAIRDAVEQKKTIICEVNPNLTYMKGSVPIPVEAVTLLYEVDTPEYCIGPVSTSPEEDKIGEMVASLIEDGDTIQMGIGGIPDTVGKHLMDKHDLGLHTEQFTSSMADLIEAGVITGARKPIDTGIHVGVFADGTHELYQYLHNNPKCLCGVHRSCSVFRFRRRLLLHTGDLLCRTRQGHPVLPVPHQEGRAEDQGDSDPRRRSYPSAELRPVCGHRERHRGSARHHRS